MKAVICKKYGPPEDLVIEEIADLSPGPNDVLVRVKACSVNFPDTLIIRGLYQFKPECPFTPGSDIAGIVEAVGDNVKHLKQGDEVFGMVPFGGFAEQVLVPKHNCFPKPPGMGFELAASFLMTYGTSYHALKDRAQLREGERLLVLGAAGGVGLAAVELGKLMGAQVIAAASTDEKLEICKAYGASETINYRTEDFRARIKTITDGKGVDVVYDPVGGKYSEPAFRSTAWKGRHLVVGFAAGEIPKIPLNLPLLKGSQIVGVFWGKFAMTFPNENMANTMQLVQWQAEGKINPRIHATLQLEEVSKALNMIAKREVKGKVILKI